MTTVPVCLGLRMSWDMELSVLKPGESQASQDELVTSLEVTLIVGFFYY